MEEKRYFAVFFRCIKEGEIHSGVNYVDTEGNNYVPLKTLANYLVKEGKFSNIVFTNIIEFNNEQDYRQAQK